MKTSQQVKRSAKQHTNYIPFFLVMTNTAILLENIIIVVGYMQWYTIIPTPTYTIINFMTFNIELDHYISALASMF